MGKGLEGKVVGREGGSEAAGRVKVGLTSLSTKLFHYIIKQNLIGYSLSFVHYQIFVYYYSAFY